MAFISMLFTWLGATVWLGALALRWIIDAGDDVAIKPDAIEQEYQIAYRTAQCRLRYFFCAGTGAIIVSTAATTVIQGRVTPLQAASSVIAALTLLGLVFHVEHYPWPQQPASRYTALALLSFSLSGVVLCITALPLLTSLPDFADTLTHTAVVLSCGALIGTTLVSSALTPLRKHLPSPQQERILAAIASRWTLHVGGWAGILAIAGGDSARRVWGESHPLALLAAAGAEMPLIAVIVLRGIIRLRLEYMLAAMPIAGMRDRTLLARTQQVQAAARGVARCGLGVAISILLIAGATIAVNLRPMSAPPTRVTDAVTPSPSATPTSTPVPAQTSLMLTQKDNGISVTLSGGPLVIGKNTLRLAIANAQGQPIAGASVMVVVNAMLSDAGGVTLQANPDPTNNAPGFSAAIAVTHAGTWQIVALVATADQSLRATVVFTVSIAGTSAKTV